MARNSPRFGAHMSAAGGLENAFDAGAAVGCDCLQIFVKNQRQWRAAPLSDDQIASYRDAQARTSLMPVVAHASYLLNLASPDNAKRKQSVHALVDEHRRCEALGVDYLVFHPGAHMDGTEREGIRRIARSLDEVSRSGTNEVTTVLLETTAGQGTALGHRFEQLAIVLEQAKHPEHYGICLDTCHLFAAGYDFRSPDGYAAMIDELDRVIGLANVKCIHVNDSKKELASRVDRHEHIGKGKIGKSGFANFVNDERFRDVPFILETPKGKDGRGSDLDKVNLKRLRSLVKG